MILTMHEFHDLRYKETDRPATKGAIVHTAVEPLNNRHFGTSYYLYLLQGLIEDFEVHVGRGKLRYDCQQGDARAKHVRTRWGLGGMLPQ